MLKNLGPKNLRPHKKLSVEKILGYKKSKVQNIFRSKKYFGQKKFGPKNFGVQKLGPLKTWVRNFWSEFGQQLLRYC